MIFDVLKKRWLRKQQVKLSKESRRSSATKPLSMVVLYDADLEKSTLFMERWARELGIKKYESIGFKRVIDKEADQQQNFFNLKSLKWVGGIADPRLHKILNTKYDLQINFIDQLEDLPSYVALKLPSGIKAGLPSQSVDHYDIAIGVQRTQKELFIKELNKYLNIITK